jgi:FdhD protein
MRTPGHDVALAAGLLLSEGIIDDHSDLSALGHLPGDPDENTVIARFAAGVEAHAEAIERARREGFTSSACGVCGRAAIDHALLGAREIRPAPLSPDLVATLSEALRAAQTAFAQTGGVHAAALVSPDGLLHHVHEDVGRHNAVDKALGAALLDDTLFSSPPWALLVSSRAGFEIVQKASAAGIGAVYALGAATTLAVDLAEARGIALTGFLRPERWVRYRGS